MPQAEASVPSTTDCRMLWRTWSGRSVSSFRSYFTPEVPMIPDRRSVTLVVLVLALLLSWSAPAAAHTGFDYSDPGDGETGSAPVTEITLAFTGAAEPTGEGFQVLGPDGLLRSPIQQESSDGSTWVLRFNPALSGGTFGVRWTVKAPDSHPIDGSFAFTVAERPSVAVTRELADDGSVGQSAAELEGGTLTTDALDTSRDRVELNEFLSAGEGATNAAERFGALGRAIGLLGVALAVGALVFAATVLRGTRGDIHFVLLWVRRGGLVVMVGALVELVAQLAVESGGDWQQAFAPSIVTNVLWGSFGVAVGLRLLGGRALVLLPDTHVARAVDAPDRVIALREFAAVASRELVGASMHGPPPGALSKGDVPESPEIIRGAEPFVHVDDHAWVPTTDSLAAFLGAAALVGSYVFDGHTVTKGDRGFTGLLDIVHVGAGAVWVGGVAMLAAVLWRRQRDGRELRSLQLALRFSVVASIALVAVGGAGLALAITILDSPGELWSTPWGRILVAKMAIVGVAAAMGGYNHKVLIPQMAARPHNVGLEGQFRRAVTTEGMILAAVLVVTAILVGAAS